MQKPRGLTDVTDLDPAAQRVEVPTYDRHGLQPSIVHIGVGGFHRAHLAVYIDDLAAQGHNWSIVGAGILPGDTRMAEVLHAQDGLYTLIVRGLEATSVRVIASIVDYVHGHPDPAPLVERIADPATRIVSLTVTEGGYPIDDATGEYAADSSVAGENGAFHLLARALDLRRSRDVGPITVLSCDNIMTNGEAARASTLGEAEQLDPDLAAWIRGNVTFPNSMVDRITPATSDADRQWLQREHAIVDGWPVVTEPFRQWVLEDKFAAGRPPFEDLGVIITDDVEPYELMKLRLLNAGHSCLAYLAALASIEFVHEAMDEPLIRQYLRRFLDVEAAPTLDPVPGIDLEAYKTTLIERFSNPNIADQIARLCLDGSAKFPKFLLPSVRSQLDNGGPVELCALGLAGWAVYLNGTADDGTSFVPAPDPGLSEAQAFAARAQDDPAAFLAYRAVFDDEVADNPRFVAAFTAAVQSLQSRGVRATIETMLATSDESNVGNNG